MHSSIFNSRLNPHIISSENMAYQKISLENILKEDQLTDISKIVFLHFRSAVLKRARRIHSYPWRMRYYEILFRKLMNFVGYYSKYKYIYEYLKIRRYLHSSYITKFLLFTKKIRYMPLFLLYTLSISNKLYL